MSRISQDFINSVGYLYEEINIQQNDFLNEESQYYDEEASELVEDIIATISTSMVYEGYSAEGVIGFLADSPEESIIEKYLSFDESILTESNVSEEYIEEQLQQLDEIIGAALRIARAGFKAAKYAKNVKGAAPIARLSAGLKGAGTAAERVAKQGIKASSVVRSTLSKGVQKVKDVAKGAKAALTSPTAKKIAKGALIGGTGVLAGYAGAKLGSGDGKVGPKLVGPKIVCPKIVGPKIVGPKPSSPSGGGGSGGGRSSTPSSTSPKPNPTKPKVADKAPEGETGMQKWARLHPNLASKVKPGQSGYDEISAKRTKPGPNEKQDQTPTQGSPDAKVDPKAVNDAIKAQQERDKNRAKPQAVNASYEYDAYDLVLEYLLSQGHVETVEEANYVMLVMDAETIGTIVEEYENDLLAEEITEWVNELVEGGYDLSEYTWDDLAEYYVNEATIRSVTSPSGKRIYKSPEYSSDERTNIRKTAHQQKRLKQRHYASTSDARDDQRSFEHDERQEKKKRKHPTNIMNAKPGESEHYGADEGDGYHYDTVKTDRNARKRRASGR